MALTVLPLEVGGGRLDDDGEHEKKNIWKIKERKEQKKGLVGEPATTAGTAASGRVELPR